MDKGRMTNLAARAILVSLSIFLFLNTYDHFVFSKRKIENRERIHKEKEEWKERQHQIRMKRYDQIIELLKKSGKKGR